MAIKYVQMYFSYLEPLSDLTDEQLGRVTRAILEYGRDKTVPAFEGPESLAFKFIKSNFDRESAAYDAISVKRSECGKRGGAPKGNQNARKTSKNNQNNQTSQEEEEEDEEEEKEEKEEDEESSSSDDEVVSSAQAAEMTTTMSHDSLLKMEDTFGMATGRTAQRLKNLTQKLSPELVDEILDTCLDNNARTYPYLLRALEKAVADGVRTVDQYRAGHVSHSSGHNVRVDRTQPSGNDFLKNAVDRPRRLKRTEGE